MKNNSGIYIIINKVNGKVYIGQSKRIEDEVIDGKKVKGRISGHLTDLKYNRHHKNKSGEIDHLQKAYNKYGKENFEFKVLKYCKQEDLTKWEQYYMNLYNSTNPHCGYNKTLKANNSVFSDETKRKISIAKKGTILSEQAKLNMSKAAKGRPSHNKGKKISEETREKMCKSLKGRKSWNKGMKGQYHIGTKGRKHTEETKKKMSDAKKGKPSWNKGIPMTDEQKQKLIIANTGRPSWNKGKKMEKNVWNKGKKMTNVVWNKGVPCSEETKNRISISKKKYYEEKRIKLLSNEGITIA